MMLDSMYTFYENPLLSADYVSKIFVRFEAKTKMLLVRT